jgi:hypothetical protein
LQTLIDEHEGKEGYEEYVQSLKEAQEKLAETNDEGQTTIDVLLGLLGLTNP